MTKDELIAFEEKVKAAFANGEIRGPIHLCGGNEDQLIELFKRINRDDWVFSTWRHDYHALLHGIPEETLMAEIMAGRGINFSSAKHKFFTSAIVGGILPIAVGVAHALQMKISKQTVWCFVGDMTATTGAFHEANSYASKNNLPIRFIIEKNDFSADSPTRDCWGKHFSLHIESYHYKRTQPHSGVGHWVDIK